MQVNAIPIPSRAPRHTSYVSRSISGFKSHTSTEDITREARGREEKAKEKDGRCEFISGVRRISLVSGRKHDDTDKPQSPPSIPQTPPPAMPTVMVPSISSQLLPPIELQPMSPPRDQEPDEPRRSMASERSVISTSACCYTPLPQSSTATQSTYLRPTRLSNMEEMAKAQLDKAHAHAHEQTSRARKVDRLSTFGTSSNTGSGSATTIAGWRP
jgi:hypothetical protein